MAYYNTCPNCGCNLDPGEKCDCGNEKAKEQEKKREFFDRHLKMEPKAGQLAFVFDNREGSYEKKMCI